MNQPIPIEEEIQPANYDPPVIPAKAGIRGPGPSFACGKECHRRPSFSSESLFQVELSRRGFVKLLGSGLLITVAPQSAQARRTGGGGGRSNPVAARVHIAADGTITAMTGKVEEGQGARAQITQAAAEELCVRADDVHLVMSDTALVPDDGITAGSRTTPSTIPAVRQGAATARRLLQTLAARRWDVEPDSLQIENGVIAHPSTGRTMTYAQLAESTDIDQAFAAAVDPGIALRPVSRWKVMGESYPRPNLRDIVTGAHRYPSDVVRPNMLFGKVLRPPAYGATLESIDLSPAQAMEGVVVHRDGDFVGCAAPTSQQAARAVEAIARTAVWKTIQHPSSKDISKYLKDNSRDSRRAVDSSAAKTLSGTYELAYIQHTPMEPRAATAEWDGDKLTAWAASDYPQRAQGDLARTFGLPQGNVHVIVPDMGGGFGGKHSAEAAEEAARLAKAAGRPVAVHWTRAEEFTWAYFRPAAVIEVTAGLDDKGTITAWDFANINAGGAAIDTPYRIANKSCRSVGSRSPLRQGAYRCLAATGNNFARESFMDELATAAGADPLEFRMAHLDDPRIRAVLEKATTEFRWKDRVRQKQPEDRGIGLACGTEKGSVVAACVEIEVDRTRGAIRVLHVCEAFEPGPVQNPANLTSQVQGCIVMGLGGALREAMEFEDGRILNASFSGYRVPRFADTPKIDVHLISKNDIPSVGGGETPIIAIAPAVGNAVFNATGIRLRTMPMKAEVLKNAP